MVQTIAVLDFGSQYTQVIARRVRECRVYSKIYRFGTPAAKLAGDGVIGIVLSGGPSSVFAKNAPMPDPAIFELGVPVLGICYGLQLMGRMLGGGVARSSRREYGRGVLSIRRPGRLFAGLPRRFKVWNSHGDKVTRLPRGFAAVGATENSPFAAFEDARRRILRRSSFIPRCSTPRTGSKSSATSWSACAGRSRTGPCATSSPTPSQISARRSAIRASSWAFPGGVDSSVAAALIHKAVGRQLTCVFVDNGLLRKGERGAGEPLYSRNFHLDVRVVDASKRVPETPQGVIDPERKRKIIGRTFVEVFERSLRSIGGAEFLAQGTLYPDVIESVAIGDNPAALIKSHHNVGGLPRRMKLGCSSR